MPNEQPRWHGGKPSGQGPRRGRRRRHPQPQRAPGQPQRGRHGRHPRAQQRRDADGVGERPDAVPGPAPTPRPQHCNAAARRGLRPGSARTQVSPVTRLSLARSSLGICRQLAASRSGASAHPMVLLSLGASLTRRARAIRSPTRVCLPPAAFLERPPTSASIHRLSDRRCPTGPDGYGLPGQHRSMRRTPRAPLGSRERQGVERPGVAGGVLACTSPGLRREAGSAKRTVTGPFRALQSRSSRRRALSMRLRFFGEDSIPMTWPRNLPHGKAPPGRAGGASMTARRRIALCGEGAYSKDAPRSYTLREATRPLTVQPTLSRRTARLRESPRRIRPHPGCEPLERAT